MLLAVSLTCGAALALACKKEPDDATSVEKEKVKKPKKPDPDEPKPKKDKVWAVDEGKTPGHCVHAKFCTTNPQITNESDASALYAQCGSSAKIPKSVAFSETFIDRNASFHSPLTEEQRKEKDEPDACCYSYQVSPCGKGRPMRYENELVLAPEIARTGWGDIDVAAAAREVAATPERIAHWKHVALLEHGSVAAFANVSLELMALGAPASMVEAAHVAALDEIRHARIFWSLVKELSDEDVGPGPMTIPHQPIDAERILVSTVVEGCVGETLGALVFFEVAERVGGELGKLYRAIAEEEATHAELAFRIVRFLVGSDPRLAERARDAARRASRQGSPMLDLDEKSQRFVLDRGFEEVVMPALDRLAASVDSATLRA
jgi:hypothetical protein